LRLLFVNRHLVNSGNNLKIQIFALPQCKYLYVNPFSLRISYLEQ